MKFLNSEGRLICLLEKEDATTITNRNIPTIDLLVIPLHLKEHIENSHVWTNIYPKVRKGLHSVVYF